MDIPIQIPDGTHQVIIQLPSNVDVVSVTWALVIATIFGIGITAILTWRSNSLITLELRAKFKPLFDFREREIIKNQTKPLKFFCKMLNVSNIAVRDIVIYHSEYPIRTTINDVIKNWKDIKKIPLEKMESTLEPQHYHGISFPISFDTTNDLRIIIWLEYEYVHGKEECIVFLDHEAAGKTGFAWFDNDYIKNKRKELKV